MSDTYQVRTRLTTLSDIPGNWSAWEPEVPVAPASLGGASNGKRRDILPGISRSPGEYFIQVRRFRSNGIVIQTDSVRSFIVSVSDVAVDGLTASYSGSSGNWTWTTGSGSGSRNLSGLAYDQNLGANWQYALLEKWNPFTTEHGVPDKGFRINQGGTYPLVEGPTGYIPANLNLMTATNNSITVKLDNNKSFTLRIKLQGGGDKWRVIYFPAISA